MNRIIQFRVDDQLMEEILANDVNNSFEKIQKGDSLIYSYNPPISKKNWRVSESDVIYFSNFFSLNLEGNPIEEMNVYRSADLEIHVKSKTVYKNGKQIQVLPTCLTILLAMLESQNGMISRKGLIRLLEIQNRKEVQDNTLNQHIKRLRDSLGTYCEQEYFTCIYKVGYQWNFEVQKEKNKM